MEFRKMVMITLYAKQKKNWCFWTVVLEKTLECPLDCKIHHSSGDQSWVFIWRTDAEAETPILWPPHMKSWLIGKEPDSGRVWGQEEKGMTEDEMAGWHHKSMDMGLGRLQKLVMTGRPSMLRFMGSQRVGHDWVTELNWKLSVLCLVTQLFLTFVAPWTAAH